MIECGRYRGVPINERLCHHCQRVEDEIHVLLECKHHKTFKSNNHINPLLPNEVIFKQLMMSTNSKEVFSLGSFISKAFRARDIDAKVLPKFF